MSNRISQLFTRGSRAPTSSPSSPTANHDQPAASTSTRPVTHTRGNSTRGNGHSTTTQSRRRSTFQQALQQVTHIFSHWSTPAVEEAYWCSSDMMLGAGMVIIQPETRKIVCVYERARKYWFLPKGRKDVGQSLEETALREAYEETGYQATFLPLCHPHHQPSPDRPRFPSTEPLYIHAMSWGPKYRGGQMSDPGGEYLTTWYAGQIPVDAPHHANTGMPDELNYESHLLTFDQARQIFGHDGFFGMLIEYAIQNFVRTEQILAEWERRRAQDAEEQQAQASAAQPEGDAPTVEPQGAQAGEPQGAQATSLTAEQIQGGTVTSA
ncbi:uncharacterized protein SCHCODRAFT_02639248 [Schizophyllum commune H4-8]|uniref:uncharacterized protein n=1 Tax=Schizophyllum commune (strain H4-8 / FGSC 9210) TaxID=578458 RepID=UPI00215FDC97|nr:uncharacterized protein SCHCODRAFT_02639248 [Schizophyllum commune H4-8]KAI5887925.1 hypothetical protein SCHCODRAFT_02639248 [Schizophyllum commune H4-8]